MLICLFIQDCLHYLSIIVRRISIKALSYNLAAAIIIDFIHTVGAIYLIIQYWTYYNIDRTLTRPEEKYYKIFLSTETENFQPKTVFVYLIIVIVYRMLFQLVYFKAFGPIVQIIIKMIAKCLVFLNLSLMFLFAFTMMAFILFNDIDEFSSIFYSFNTMYQSIFGGFDFTIYTKSYITREYYGRIFMCLFMLGFAVLIMNFLIAILSEVYSYNAQIANALHKKEIVKLRALYEPHKHYYCLVKAPIFINFYMILVAPFVIIWKSEKLNKVVILFQYLIVFVFIQIGTFIHLIVILPISVVFIVYRKTIYIFSKSTWASDIYDKNNWYLCNALDDACLHSYFVILHQCLYLRPSFYRISNQIGTFIHLIVILPISLFKKWSLLYIVRPFTYFQNQLELLIFW